MFRIVRFLIAVLGFSGALQALAQPTPLPVQGNLGSISGSGVPYAGIDIQLQNCASPVSIAGFWGIVQSEYQIQANSSGMVSSTIWPNDLITCNGTTGNSQYLLTYFAGGAVSGTPQCYQVVSTQGVWNLNGPQQPIACSQPAPNPQDKTYNNLTVNGFFQGNNGAFSGTFHVGGMLTASGGITLGVLPTACTGSNFMKGLSVTLQPICSALPAAPVLSWNGRTGSVVPVSGDYTYAQITNAPFLLFNAVPATVRQQWNFSQRFTGTDATPKTNIDLNAPGTGNILPTETADPGASTAKVCFDGSKNIAACPAETDYYFSFTGCTMTITGNSFNCRATQDFASVSPVVPTQADANYFLTCNTVTTEGWGSSTNVNVQTTTSFDFVSNVDRFNGITATVTPTVWCHLHHN